MPAHHLFYMRITRFAQVACVIVSVVLLNSCKKDVLWWKSTRQISFSGHNDRYNKILFTDSLHGYVFGGNYYQDAVILETTDGGATWTRSAYPKVGQLLLGCSQTPQGDIYACGFDGKLMYNVSQTNSWTYHQMEYYYFRDVSFATPNSGILIGGISFNSGLMEHIDSFGNVHKRDSFNYQLNCVKMFGADTGICCGYGIVEKTFDGGYTWMVKDVVGDNFMAMCCLNNEIWVVGYDGTIFHSNDRGDNWERLRNGNDFTRTRYRLYDILFTDHLNGWAVGEDGIVLFSNDGGHHWAEYKKFTNAPLYGIAQNKKGALFICGDYGSLYQINPI